MSEFHSKPPLHVIKGSELAVLDAGTQEFLDRGDGLIADYEGYRRRLAPEQMMSPADAGVDVEMIDPATSVSSSKPFRILRPAGASGSLPLLFYFHGCRWQKGEPHSHDRFLYEVCRRAHISIACIDDALADDLSLTDKLRTSEQIIASLLEERALTAGSRPLLIGGDGVGGYFAASLSLTWDRRHSHAPGVVLLVCPMIPGTEETSSRQQFADGPWLTARIIQQMLSSRFARQIDHSDAVLPALAGLRQLTNSPPVMIVTAENDPLRDEAETYGRNLMKAGIEVSLTRYIGTIHNFPVVDALADTAAARAAVGQIVNACMTSACR
ncbi:alpha/beta hydrolase fold domain-containing protein [Rhizobium oryzicola]|uniref:Alpha/beta hydrolase n=1 Tax=Rhizobium oryzicola TaxID=1232668 RepID=A0ABT8T2R1_9HYPH|nr:alpha/beta hydrolase [Rhizobium oryzicola]MDO1584951.1 alpha/beta hydrolase [Rhizobium oryzicola]